jgi:hypothetical protein
MTHKISWWSRASTEQKLAQIDGGIDCGMSARHIATNVGATREAITIFGHRHGRKFVAKTTSSQNRRAGVLGGLVNARQSGKPDFEMNGAFQIFDEVRL